MAPFALLSVLSLSFISAQALSLPSVTRSVATSAATAAPAPTSITDLGSEKLFCPGIFAELHGNDLSHAYCCVAGAFEAAQPVTSWFYNHTGIQIPSTVITPTTCVQPVPLTASDYNQLIALATPTPANGAQQPLITDSVVMGEQLRAVGGKIVVIEPARRTLGA